MKKTLLATLLIILATVFVGCTGTTTETTTTQTIEDLVSSLENPYNIGLFMTADPTSSMGLNFELSEETEAFVEYKEVGTDDYTLVIATNKTTPIGRKTAYLYEADMTSLEVGKTYTYHVGTTSGTVLSDDYTFTMNSNVNGDFTFMYIADPQENAELGYMAYAYAVLYTLEYSSQAYDFVMFPGDMINDSDIKTEWTWFYRYSSFFITSTPIVATIGNHEFGRVDLDRITQLEYDGYINLPDNGPVYGPFDEIGFDQRGAHIDDGKTYSFNYGNAHFTVIDTETYCDGTTECAYYDTDNVEILNNWIRDDLANSTATWNIVLLHRGPYGLSYDTFNVRNNLIPIFDEYNVDLVLSGHDHQYSRAVYSNFEMVPFSTSDAYDIGVLNISGSSNDFNHYSSSIGVTYLTGNTVATKFYGGDKSSGLEVQYKMLNEYPVIPFITVTEDEIHIISYVVIKDSAFALVPTSVQVLEEVVISK
ncbi:MAG: metallophosphoesterase [Candidatus Izemoplasmatales bacterium]